MTRRIDPKELRAVVRWVNTVMGCCGHSVEHPNDNGTFCTHRWKRLNDDFLIARCPKTRDVFVCEVRR